MQNLLPPSPSSFLELALPGRCRQCRRDVGRGSANLNLKCRQCRQCRVFATYKHTHTHASAHTHRRAGGAHVGKKRRESAYTPYIAYIGRGF